MFFDLTQKVGLIADLEVIVGVFLYLRYGFGLREFLGVVLLENLRYSLELLHFLLFNRSSLRSSFRVQIHERQLLQLTLLDERGFFHESFPQLFVLTAQFFQLLLQILHQGLQLSYLVGLSGLLTHVFLHQSFLQEVSQHQQLLVLLLGLIQFLGKGVHLFFDLLLFPNHFFDFSLENSRAVDLFGGLAGVNQRGLVVALQFGYPLLQLVALLLQVLFLPGQLLMLELEIVHLVLLLIDCLLQVLHIFVLIPQSL